MKNNVNALVPVFMLLSLLYAGAIYWGIGQVEAVKVNERLIGSVGPREQELLKKQAEVEGPKRQTLLNGIIYGGGVVLFAVLVATVLSARKK
jgi:hypothetical protein